MRTRRSAPTSWTRSMPISRIISSDSRWSLKTSPRFRLSRAGATSTSSEGPLRTLGGLASTHLVRARSDERESHLGCCAGCTHEMVFCHKRKLLRSQLYAKRDALVARRSCSDSTRSLAVGRADCCKGFAGRGGGEDVNGVSTHGPRTGRSAGPVSLVLIFALAHVSLR